MTTASCWWLWTCAGSKRPPRTFTTSSWRWCGRCYRCWQCWFCQQHRYSGGKVPVWVGSRRFSPPWPFGELNYIIREKKIIVTTGTNLKTKELQMFRPSWHAMEKKALDSRWWQWSTDQTISQIKISSQATILADYVLFLEKPRVLHRFMSSRISLFFVGKLINTIFIECQFSSL